jgi:hypothetical protein
VHEDRWMSRCMYCSNVEHAKSGTARGEQELPCSTVSEQRQIINLTWFNNYTRRVVALIYWNGFERNRLFEIENKAHVRRVRTREPCWHSLPKSFYFKDVSELRHMLQLIV